MTVTPEVMVLIERARARRLSLDGLLDVLPDEMLERSAAGDAWTVRAHLQHVATADRFVAELARAAARGLAVAWLGGSSEPGAFTSKRQAAMDTLDGAPLARLREAMRDQRQELIAVLARLQLFSLDTTVMLADVVDRRGSPASWTLRGYLAGWAEHDLEHESVIRRAITTPPSAGLVAVARPGRAFRHK